MPGIGTDAHKLKQCFIILFHLPTKHSYNMTTYYLEELCRNNSLRGSTGLAGRQHSCEINSSMKLHIKKFLLWFLSLRMKPFKRMFIYSLIHFSYWEIIHSLMWLLWKKIRKFRVLKEVCVIISNGRISSFLSQGKGFQKKVLSMRSNPV